MDRVGPSDGYFAAISSVNGFSIIANSALKAKED